MDEKKPTATTLVQPETHQVLKPVPKSNMLVYVLLAVVFLVLVGVVAFVVGNRKGSAPATDKQSQVKTSPEKTEPPVKTAGDEPAACPSGQTRYAEKSFGASFCYPSYWGAVTLSDAKIAPADTGHREVIRFSAQPYVIVGGMSEDWSTTVGRGVGCLEPDNVMPALSSYDTTWHAMEGSGADVSYAVRSLPSSAGGYSIEESISNLLLSGVCVHGHKIINGSRYKVVAVNFARDFEPASGITTPAQHIANPNILFSSELRAQYDAVLASIEAY